MESKRRNSISLDVRGPTRATNEGLAVCVEGHRVELPSITAVTRFLVGLSDSPTHRDSLFPSAQEENNVHRFISQWGISNALSF